jgi:hypothetical protein
MEWELDEKKRLGLGVFATWPKQTLIAENPSNLLGGNDQARGDTRNFAGPRLQTLGITMACHAAAWRPTPSAFLSLFSNSRDRYFVGETEISLTAR